MPLHGIRRAAASASLTPPSFVGVAYGQFNASGDVTLTYPVGTATGDLLICAMAHDIAGAMSVTMTGWTEIGTGSTLGLSTRLFWRISAGGSSVVINTNKDARGGAMLCSWTDASSTLGATSQTTDSDTSPTPSGVTGAVSALCISVIMQDNYPTLSAGPSGYTIRGNQQLGTGVENGVAIAFAEKELLSIATETPGNWTSNAAEVSVLHTVRIDPA